MRVFKGLLLIVLFIVLVVACSSSASPPDDADAPIITLSASCDNGIIYAPVHSGTTADGSKYEIYVPASWASDAAKRLLLFAHGYFDPYHGADEAKLPEGFVYDKLALPNEYARDHDKVICSLIESGFAVGWTSYNVNGFATKSGLESMEWLREEAGKKLAPKRVYAMGHSLGGLVVARLAELGSGRYAGVLPLCGPVGGGPQQIAYLGDVRVLFDFYFPNRIPTTNAEQPATNFEEPPPAWGTTLVDGAYGGWANTVAQLIRVNQASAEEMARINQIKLPYSNLDELVHSFIEPLYFNVRGTNNLLYLAGGNPFDNTKTSYSGISRTRDRQINSGVIRYAASSIATTYLKDHADTSGRLNTLVLTLHTNRDAAVPYLHQSMYANKVSAARRSSRLVQQYVDRYGHCNFKDGEILTALEGLIRWAESPLNLLKPRSGDVTQN